jgi:hypothetical protein
MPTLRTPVTRSRKRFTPEVIAAFKHLVDVLKDDTKDAEDYYKAEGELIGLLNFKPWERLDCPPCPYLSLPFPDDTPAEHIERYWNDQCVRRGVALWRQLERASGMEPLKDE